MVLGLAKTLPTNGKPCTVYSLLDGHYIATIVSF
jgi:hypothetical protein